MLRAYAPGLGTARGLPGGFRRKWWGSAVTTGAIAAPFTADPTVKKDAEFPATCFSHKISRKALALTGAESTAWVSPATDEALVDDQVFQLAHEHELEEYH
jgi:hypothetical protein